MKVEKTIRLVRVENGIYRKCDCCGEYSNTVNLQAQRLNRQLRWVKAENFCNGCTDIPKHNYAGMPLYMAQDIDDEPEEITKKRKERQAAKRQPVTPTEVLSTFNKFFTKQ